MVETIVTIHRGDVVPAAVVGAVCGLIIGRLGAPGVGFALPTLLLVVLAAGVELGTRLVSTAVLAFIAAAALVTWTVW